MNNMRVFSNNTLGLQVRTMLNEDGSISVNAEDTAKGFGFVDESKFATSGEKYVRWARVNKYLSEFGFSQQVGKDDYISEGLFYLLGMKASNEAAQEFQKWLALDVLPTLRKTGIYEMGTVEARNDLGEIASLMREWRMWAQKQKMPYNQAMSSMVNFLHIVGVPFPEDMIYLSPMNLQMPELFVIAQNSEGA